MSKRDLYYEMMKLMGQEEEVVKRVRKAEEEVDIFLFVENRSDCLVFFRHEIFNLVVNRKNFPVILKSVFTTSIAMKNRKSIENYW